MVLFHLPCAELREKERLLLSSSSLTIVSRPFLIASESSPPNTRAGGFIQTTTTPHTHTRTASREPAVLVRSCLR